MAQITFPWTMMSPEEQSEVAERWRAEELAHIAPKSKYADFRCSAIDYAIRCNVWDVPRPVEDIDNDGGERYMYGELYNAIDLLDKGYRCGHLEQDNADLDSLLPLIAIKHETYESILR